MKLRLLSSAFATDMPEHATHPDAEPVEDREALRNQMGRELEEHSGVIVDRLAQASGLAPAALWRLVADAVAVQFLDAGRRFGREAEAKADALAILKRPGSPLANKELHYVDIDVPDPRTPGRTLLTWSFRARGGCCRWYTAAPGKLCTSCVLRSDVDRRAALEDGLRRRFGLPPRSEAAPT
jgi:hypothetical protein